MSQRPKLDRPDVEVHTFTIEVTYVNAVDMEGNPVPPKWSFQPGKGVPPWEIIDMCANGVSWANEVLKSIERKRLAQAQEEKSRVWTPESGRLQ